MLPELKSGAASGIANCEDTPPWERSMVGAATLVVCSLLAITRRQVEGQRRACRSRWGGQAVSRRNMFPRSSS